MGPKDMTEEEVTYWNGVIKRMVERVFIRIVERRGGFWRRVMGGMGG